ncbi:MAG: calcium-binding protein, partial [Paracoccaceae bacterium]
MLDAKTISENLNQDLDELVVEITQRVLGQNIPFVSDDIAQQAGSLFDVMDDLKQAIDILLEKETQLDMGQLADLLNSITLDDDFVPITAKETDSGDLIVFFTMQDLASLSDLDLNAGGSIGISDDAFKLDGGVAVDLQLDYQFAIQIEQGTGDTDFAEDEVDTEVTLTINGEVDFNVAADNALGFLDVALTDNEISDPNAPKNDLMLVLGLDLKDGADSTVSMSGSATLDFNVMAGAPDIRILPEFGANVFVQVNYADADLLSDGSAAEGDFTIELRDVVFKLQALSGMLQDVFSTVSDILNTFPLGEIIDLLVARLPVVDDLAPSEFDFDEDGKITLQDVITLISVLNPDGLPPVFGFIQGVVLLAEVIDAVDELATGLAEDGCFDIGTLRLTSDALDTISNGATFPESARLISSEDSDLQNLADLVEAFGAFNDFIGLDEEVEEDAAAAPAASDTDPGAALFVSALSAASAPQSAQSSAADEGGPFDVPDVGLSFPFLASPEALASSLGSLLLNGAGAPAVSLIEFDLPPLEFRVYDEIGIRFGPFFGALYGEFYAGVDINIGYDTAGFGDSFDFAKGLYVSPDLPQVEVNGALKTPVGTVQLGVGVIGGLDVVIARVAVKGGLLGQIDVFLGGTSETDNKARLSELGGCFFNEIAGRLTAGIDLVFRFGFGAFSIERTKSIATVTLAQFDIEPCSPKPNEILDELELSDAGLAGDQGDGTLLLHVGTDSDKRSLPDAADAEFDENGDRIGDGRAETETFFVGLVPEDGDNPAADGEVAVFAFGIFQRFGNGDVALQRIVGSGGSENDTLTVSASVNLDAELSGDAGNDVLVGGGGNDILSGDEGNDQLDGDLGNDTLEGGIGNDVLRGGAGADSIDGGDDFDQVDFSQSSEGIFLIESASTAGLMLGQGGEAEGDRVRNVEHFIGSNFDDTFYGNTTVGNVFEGGLGNDVLIGGNEGDLFIGGLGADIMRGNRSGEPDTPGDGASYVFSDGGVIIDLPLGVGWGGEAQGDRFYGIENFQLSRNADRFLGDDVANLVDGYDGDDILEGGGGRDTIGAGVGNDTVFAVGDGDNLDGGGFLNYRPDMDLLSYEKASAGVNVDLHDGDGRIRGASGPGDDIAFSQYIQFNAEAENEILSRSRSDDVRISSFENLTGSVFDDVLRGDDRGNTIRGGAGDDTISGQAGDDLLVGGLGADEIFGNEGTDTADYRLSNALVFADLRDGAVGVGGHATGDTYTGVENLIGSQFADSLVGNDLNNRLDPHLNTTGSVESLVGFGGTDTAVLNYRTDSSGDGIAMFLASTGAGAVRRTEPGQTSGDLAVNLNTIEQVDAVTSAGEDQFISRIRGNDNVNTAQGDDFIDMFEGSDRIRAGAGDDVVLRFGELSSVEFLYTGAGDAMRDAYILDGGRGIDTLGVDISYTARDIVWLAEEPGATESDRVIRL